jgi:hypothetical protein
LRGNSAPYAFRMNIRQSRMSLAEIDVCSRMEARHSVHLLCHRPRLISDAPPRGGDLYSRGKLVTTSRTGDPSMRMS